MKSYIKKAKHIVEYVLFTLITSALRLLSIDNSANLCSFIARKIGPSLKATSVARKNLQRILGNEVDTDKTIDDLWDNYGRYIGEFPFINKMTDQEIEQRVKCIGIEKLKHFQDNKQPFLLLLAHQANWEFIIRRAKDLYPQFGVVYRKANNPYVNKTILKERNNDSIIMIEKGANGTRSLIKAIKSKMSIAMLVDQKMNEGINVPFFGHDAMTAPAIARLSLQYDYPIVPCQMIRIDGTSSFELVIHSPLEYDATGDTQKDCYDIMLMINQTIEGWIRQKPAQWFWFHNRWK
ncbi:MAG: lipid A biosynthesis lauroyl acyltransferase [Rickettsiales bacterium]|nr:MAG: lipid A biosynthesis lauroyl acyltransferase [Rickettsiales bacterium]